MIFILFLKKSTLISTITKETSKDITFQLFNYHFQRSVRKNNNNNYIVIFPFKIDKKSLYCSSPSNLCFSMNPQGKIVSQTPSKQGVKKIFEILEEKKEDKEKTTIQMTKEGVREEKDERKRGEYMCGDNLNQI